jgi:3-hydroxybutyryl-CoA dehydratase
MLSFKDLEIGQTASTQRSFAHEDLVQFANLSLDSNLVHFDEEFAKTTIFGKRIVHGFLYASLISGVLGTKLPGMGAIYLSQEMKFLRPVYIGENITATVTVSEKDLNRNIVNFETICTKDDGTIVLAGNAKIKC